MSDDSWPIANEAEAERDEFYTVNRTELLSYALSLTGNDHDAEDAVSEAVLKSYEYFAKHRQLCPPGKDPVGYLKVIIRNHLIDAYRHSKVEERRRPELSPLVAEDIAEQVVGRVMAEQFFEAMRSLKPGHYQIALMYWAQGKSYEEIAESLKIPESTARSSITRIRRRLLKQLGLTNSPLAAT